MTTETKIGAVELRPSPINGTGVFALVTFAAGDIITREDDSFVVTSGNPLPPGEDDCHCDWYADGRQVWLPAPERHFNHSCEPNSVVRFIAGVRHTVAIGDIAGGQEITHEYCVDGFGDTVWQCSCGSATCRKDIHADFFHLPLELQVKYLPYLSDLCKRVYKGKVAALKRRTGLP